jgi:hypothetical protein
MLALASVAPVRALEDTAREILDRYNALGNGEHHWTDRQAHLRVTTAGGPVIELMAYQRRAPGDVTKTSLLVQAPGDLRGTGVLMVTRGSGPSEQWRYRPDDDTLERIDATSGNGPVLNSDLTFQDLALLEQVMRWTEADAHATLRGEEGIDLVATHAIEFEPRRADIPYREVVLWLGRDDMTPRQLHLFGNGPYPVRRIQVTTLRSEGAIPWPERVEIETPAAGTRTTIDATNVVFNRRADDDLFTPQGLARAAR